MATLTLPLPPDVPASLLETLTEPLFTSVDEPDAIATDPPTADPPAPAKILTEPPCVAPLPAFRLSVPPLLDDDAPLEIVTSAPDAPPLTPAVIPIAPDEADPELPVVILI